MIQSTLCYFVVTFQRPGLVYAWVLLTDVLIRLNLSHEALITCNKAVKLLKSLSNSARIKDKVDFQQFQLLSLSKDDGDWKKCLDIFKEKVYTQNFLSQIIKSFFLGL